jgi:hypothetical protein
MVFRLFISQIRQQTSVAVILVEKGARASRSSSSVMEQAVNNNDRQPQREAS